MENQFKITVNRDPAAPCTQQVCTYIIECSTLYLRMHLHLRVYKHMHCTTYLHIIIHELYVCIFPAYDHK